MAEKKVVRRGSGPFVISGNDLRGGYVVWLGAGDSWTPDFTGVLLLQTEEEAAVAMGRATADPRELEVVDVHIVDVTAGQDGTRPVTYREKIRAHGPTIPIVRDAHA